MFIKKFALASFTVLSLFFISNVHAGAYAIHVTQKGESLGIIGNSYHISIDAITSVNDFDSLVIQPNQLVKIPYLAATGGLAELAPSPPIGFLSHTLKKGETLSDLASEYGITLEAIIGANPDISSLDYLPTGLELLIPPEAGLVVTIHSATQLENIIETYKLSPKQIVEANSLISPAQVIGNTMIFLPGIKPQKSLDRLARVREAEHRFIWPLHGRITSYFGRRNLGMGTSNFHKGIDIAAPQGTAVRASRSGIVVYAGWSRQGYGNLVKIRHNDGTETRYAHFSKIKVVVDQQVRQGDIVGLVGSTGLSTGPHLHFEIRERGRATDPLLTLSN